MAKTVRSSHGGARGQSLEQGITFTVRSEVDVFMRHVSGLVEAWSLR